MLSIPNGVGPKAYLGWLIFDKDKDFVFIDGGYKRMTDKAKENGNDVAHEKLEKDLHITQAGYVYIYLSNDEETPVDVFFDDFEVTHNGSYVSQATDYGVWGDVLREQRAALDTTYLYRYAYQGKYAEKDKETGWSHFELREFDPIIGRWTSMDPNRQHYSPYVGMGNNPVNSNDPDGGLDEYELVNGVIKLTRADPTQSEDFLTIGSERKAFETGILKDGIDIENKGMETSKLTQGISLAYFISTNIDLEIAGVGYKNESGKELLVINPYSTSTNTFNNEGKVVSMSSQWNIQEKYSSEDFTGTPYKAFHVHPGHPLSGNNNLGKPIPSFDDRRIAQEAYFMPAYQSIKRWYIYGRSPVNGSKSAYYYYDRDYGVVTKSKSIK